MAEFLMEEPWSNIYISHFRYEDTDLGDLRFSKSTDNGVTWSTEIIDSGSISGSSDTGWFTSLKTVGNTIYILYYDVSNETLKLAKSIDAGETWE